MTEVDPLSLQVFSNLFSSVAEEMGVTLQRASYSPNIKMRRDFSCAVFDAHGRLLAQAAHIPVHLGAMPMAMRVVIDRIDLKPGDIVALNDPYAGGTHLPDISFASAVYGTNEERLGYVMCRAHHADIGGMSPGSMPLSTEIYQEGIIIPPVLLVRDGTMQQDVMEIVLRNVRTPAERQGDFAAQIAAQRVGEERLRSLAGEYGIGCLADHGVALQEYSERMMRQLISTIPPGEYHYVDYLDDDGFSSRSVRVEATVRRATTNTDLEIDFTGSALQCHGPVNAVQAVTRSAVLYVLCCLQQEDVPVNAGSMEPLHIITPPKSVLAAEPPAAVAAGNVETSQRIVDVLFAALAEALPQSVPAASQGTMNNLTVGGFDTRRGTPFAYYETMGGGAGGRPAGNGMSGVHDHMSNTLNTPVEALESTYPVRILRYGLRSGSGGEGLHPGGEGLQRDLQFLEAADVTILSDRRRFPPYGLSGGEPGRVGENLVARNGTARPLPGKVRFRVNTGEVLSLRSPGGGGWG